MFKRARSNYGVHILRRRVLGISALLIFLTAFAFIFSLSLDFFKDKTGSERRTVLNYWNEAEYEEVYRISEQYLQKKPLDTLFLTMHGFSAYQLSTAQINMNNTIEYLDECIWSLRKAMLTRTGAKDIRIPYVLGKAYYHKGASHADLAVEYLEMARVRGFESKDLAEYLGLSYAALKDYRNSVIAFSRALEPYQSNEDGTDTEEKKEVPDLLLLSIARSYLGLGETASAKAYLIRCIESTKDSQLLIKAKLLHAKLLMDESDHKAAETIYLQIIDIDDHNAEAHYQLGELYAAAGDPVKARAEWRKSIRIDPTYGPARERLNI